ncbi:MAG: UvrD-helicase domain-containing protein [Planctomycetaceae bacterium]
MSSDRVISSDGSGQRPFRYTEHPLPVGTVVDASAGTGKTYAVASYVTLALAKDDSLSIGKVLVTTFTRNAAAELRDRVRRRIVATAAMLRNAAVEPADELDLYLREGKAGDPAAVAARLERAAAEFDTATIATIHAVSARVLACAGRQVQNENREDVRDRIIAEVVNDELVRESAAGRTWSEDRIVKLVDKAASDPFMGQWIEPAEAGDRRTPLEQVGGIVSRCVGRVHQAMAAQPSYDDLLRLAWEAVDGTGGAAVVAQLRERFQLAIVDEAQDTDPLQWKLFRRLFPGDDGRRLITVGDPKQAIYGFRGADVNAYVAFTGSAERRTLPVNRRSDRPIVETLNSVMADAAFLAAADDPTRPLVRYERVDPVDPRGVSRIVGPDPVEFLFLGEATNQNALAEPVVRRIVALLDPEATRLRHGDATRPVNPGDICVIVRTKGVGNHVAKLLARLRIRAVTAGTMSVMRGEMAGAILDLLEAMDRPSRLGCIRRAAVTRFFGRHSLRDAGSLSEEAIRPVQEAIAALATIVRRQGIAACGAAITADAERMRCLTAGTEGQRHLADFTHIIELLHEHGPGGGCRPDELLSAFARLERLDDEHDMVVRRVESDDDAVKIMTVHSAKGLEFPCVIVADLWKAERSQQQKNDVIVFHDAGGRRVIDLAYALGRESPTAAAAAARLYREEQKRLLYVAVTRAQHFLCVLTATGRQKTPSTSRQKSPPADEPAAEPEEASILPEVLCLDGVVKPRPVAELPSLPARWRGADDQAPAPPTDVAPLPPGGVRQTYERTSFSGIMARRVKRAAEFVDTAGGHDEESDVATLTTADAAGDFPEAERPAAAGPEAGSPATFVLPELPAGTAFGSVVHEIFERIDPTHQLEAEVKAVVEATATSAMFAGRHATLVEMIVRAMQTPFGSPLGDLRFAGFAAEDRLAEMDFEMALADMAAEVQAGDVGRVFEQVLPETDPFRRCGYTAELSGPTFSIPLAGLINGSIDAVLRIRGGAGGRPRLVIADYKTNKLHRADAARPEEAYAPDLLVGAMTDHHYPLQAAVYGTAVYRMLRWKLRDPDPADCIAGIVYAFVRGTRGGDAPADAAGRRHGMFVWQPPAVLWPRLSSLFAGDRP